MARAEPTRGALPLGTTSAGRPGSYPLRSLTLSVLQQRTCNFTGAELTVDRHYTALGNGASSESRRSLIKAGASCRQTDRRSRCRQYITLARYQNNIWPYELQLAASACLPLLAALRYRPRAIMTDTSHPHRRRQLC